MNRLDSGDWQSRVAGFNQSETQTGHYYWHNDDGMNYCHYLDASGYNWYGWYVGDQYFWTRSYNGRWWWYDSDFNRWCFWNNNFWWWQDPNHVADLYCYNNDNYIPCNSAVDQVVVTAPDDSMMRTLTSPDGTRIVKLDEQTLRTLSFMTPRTRRALTRFTWHRGLKAWTFRIPATDARWKLS